MNLRVCGLLAEVCILYGVQKAFRPNWRAPVRLGRLESSSSAPVDYQISRHQIPPITPPYTLELLQKEINLEYLLTIEIVM